MGRTFMEGEAFVANILSGQRDFANIEVEMNLHLRYCDRYEELREYLMNADLKEAPLVLKNSRLTGLEAHDLQLPYLQAEGADFGHSAIYNVNMEEGNFKAARFTYARLCNSTFRRCNLEGADFRAADLHLVYLGYCSLGGADFESAMLEYTNLEGSDLRGLQNLDRARSVATANFQFAELTEAEKVHIRAELWQQMGKKRRLFGGTG